MSEEQPLQPLHPQTGDAQAIRLDGETWAPAATDDAEAAPPVMKNAFFIGEDGLRGGWSIAIYFVLAVLGTFVMLFLVSGGGKFRPHTWITVNGVKENYPFLTIYSHLTKLGGFLTAAWVMSKIEARQFAQYGLSLLPSAHRLKQFLYGSVLGFAMLSLLVFTLKSLGLLVFDPVGMRGSPALVYAIKWMLAMFLVGITEEYVLRGYLQFTLARSIGGLQRSKSVQAIGFWIAAVIWSTCFGLMHMGNKGESHFGVLAAGLAGFVFCVALYRTGSLWFPIGFHMAWNWAQTYLYGVGDSGTYGYGHLLNSHPQGNPVLSGGTVGPEGSLFVLPTLLITALVMWFTLPNEGYPEYQAK